MFLFFKRKNDFQRANQALVGEDYPRAKALYLCHAESNPGDAGKAYAGAAECCLRSNVLPHPVKVENGVTLVSAGDRHGAEHYFRLALEADPANLRALWGLSELLPEDSVERGELLERLVAKQPGILSLIALGDFWINHRKNFDKAHELYVRACEHNPKDRTTYERLEEICRRVGRDEEANMWKLRWSQVAKTKRRVDGNVA